MDNLFEDPCVQQQIQQIGDFISQSQTLEGCLARVQLLCESGIVEDLSLSRETHPVTGDWVWKMSVRLPIRLSKVDVSVNIVTI